MMDCSTPFNIFVKNIMKCRPHCHNVEQLNGTVEKLNIITPLRFGLLTFVLDQPVNYKSKAYIDGYIKYENLHKLLASKHDKLTIVTTLPFENDELINKYNVTKMKKPNTYIKNDHGNNCSFDMIILSQYTDINGNIEPITKTEYISQHKIYKDKWNQDICEILIFYDNYDVTENQFITMMYDICDDIHKIQKIKTHDLYFEFN